MSNQQERTHDHHLALRSTHYVSKKYLFVAFMNNSFIQRLSMQINKCVHIGLSIDVIGTSCLPHPYITIQLVHLNLSTKSYFYVSCLEMEVLLTDLLIMSVVQYIFDKVSLNVVLGTSRVKIKCLLLKDIYIIWYSSYFT